MAGTDLVLLLIKHSLTVALALLVLRAFHASSAARRVFVARCCLGALLLTPLVWLMAPPLALPAPLAISALIDQPLAIPALPWMTELVPEPPAVHASAARWGRVILFAYGAVAMLCLLRLALSLIRLQRISLRARPIDAGPWHATLERLRTGAGMRRAVRLRASGAIAAPISWGIWRPVIVLDENSLAHAAPDEILSHELAHIANADWPTLMLARTLAALYWWHPLMHLLRQHLAHDMECAADDAVLASGAPASRYAAILVTVSRHASQHGGGSGAGPGSLASHIASAGAALVARVSALLDTERRRGRVSRRQSLACILLTAVLVIPLGALALRGERAIWPEQLFDLDGSAGAAGHSAAQQLRALGNPNFTALAEAMRRGDFSLRHAIDTESFRQRAAIPALVLALQDERPVVRRLALWGLSEMRFPETARAVAAMSRDPVPEVRAEAASALGDLGETHWLPALEAMLRDPAPQVRRSAAHALGDLGDAAAAAALMACLHDPDPEVVAEVIWALRELD